jgi:hypothetical protein
MNTALICLAIYLLIAGFTLTFRQDLVWGFQQRRRGGLRTKSYNPDPNWQSNMTLIGVAGFGLGFAIILYLLLS